MILWRAGVAEHRIFPAQIGGKQRNVKKKEEHFSVQEEHFSVQKEHFSVRKIFPEIQQTVAAQWFQDFSERLKKS